MSLLSHSCRARLVSPSTFSKSGIFSEKHFWPLWLVLCPLYTIRLFQFDVFYLLHPLPYHCRCDVSRRSRSWGSAFHCGFLFLDCWSWRYCKQTLFLSSTGSVGFEFSPAHRELLQAPRFARGSSLAPRRPWSWVRPIEPPSRILCSSSPSRRQGLTSFYATFSQLFY